MNKHEFFMTTVGLVCLLGVTAYSVFGTNDKVVTEEITVPQGSTLYQEVAKTVNEKNNINEVVSRALRDNDIHGAGNIQPNQKITITYKK